MNSLQIKLRKLLQGHEGMTTRQLSKHVGSGMQDITRSLKAMPDAYVDRWTGPERGQWAAVWCVVEVPEDCPKPNEKNMEAPLLQTQRANRARQDSLGDGKSQRAAVHLGADNGQATGGQALGSLGKTLWQRLRGTHTQLDAGDQKQ
jgi:hypothetical protein